MKTYRFIYALIIVVFILSACGAQAPAASAHALGRRAAAQHNVQVQVIYYASYPDTYADLLIGKVDGLSAIVGDTLLINNQTSLKFVFPVDASAGADEIIAAPNIQSVT